MTFDRTIAATQRFAPPGHFYSPHPRLEDLEAMQDSILAGARDKGGIDYNSTEQLALLEQSVALQPVGLWPEQSAPTHRYYYNNHFFRFGDANAIWQMAQIYRPKRVIEVGSGYSTACWLDTFDALQLVAKLTCIEPYPARLHQLCRQDDLVSRIDLLEKPVQEIPLEFFTGLAAGDVLFIDSTHVAKSGSDVNYLFFQVLPRLAPGVLIHIHDIFWPFEYPLSWYQEGRAWNECFFLRAFLQFNSAFRIIRFNSYLAQHHANVISQIDQKFVSDAGGSIWLTRNA